MENKNIRFFLAPFERANKTIADLLTNDGNSSDDETTRIRGELSLVTKKIDAFLNENFVVYKIPLLEQKEFGRKIKLEISKARHETFSTGNFTHEEFLKYLELIKEAIKKYIPTERAQEFGNAISNWAAILNSNATNALSQLPTNANSIKAYFTYDDDYGKYTLFAGQKIKITIDDTHITQLGNALILFKFLLQEFTRNTSAAKSSKQKKLQISDFEPTESREIFFDEEKFRELRHIGNTTQDTKNFRRSIKQMMETLQKIKMNFEEINPINQTKTTYEFNLFAGKKTEEYLVKRSKNSFFIINYDLVKYLLERNYITYIPNGFYEIDTLRQPHAVSVADYLCSLYSMNYSKSNKGMVNIVNLLKNSTIPTFEAVNKNGRHYFRDIIEPLDRTLEYLVELKIIDGHWQWQNAKGEPLTEEQLALDEYKLLKKINLSYTLLNYPDELQQKRIERMESEKERKVADQKKKD